MLEVCVDSLESITAAVEGGAERIELCSALGEGGLTPSVGLLKMTKTLYPNLKVFTMLRPRGGSNFLYTDHELKIILHDMNLLIENGADGLVFGALNTDRTINEQHCSLIKMHSNNLPLTFHRAFDLTDPQLMIKHLEKIEELGYTRLLTSGFEKTAELGLVNIKQLIECSKRIIVMPGAGVNVENVEKILNESGCREFHASAKSSIGNVTDGGKGKFDFGMVTISDRNVVRKLSEIGRLYR